MNKGALLHKQADILTLRNIEHESLCNTDATTIINKVAMAKSRKCSLKQ